MAHAAAQVTSTTRRTRQRFLTWVTDTIGDRGRVVLPTREIAEAFGISQSVAYYHLRALTRAGSLVAHARGRNGMELRLPSAPRPHRQNPGASAAAQPAARSPGAKLYCPWCGAPAQSSWKHCTECGKRLPWGPTSSEPAPRRGRTRVAEG